MGYGGERKRGEGGSEREGVRESGERERGEREEDRERGKKEGTERAKMAREGEVARSGRGFS